MLKLIKPGKFYVMIVFLSLAIGNYSLAYTQETNHANLNITVTGLKSDDGNIRISIFNTKKNWLKEHVHTTTVTSLNKNCEWVVENLPYGDYAVSVYHDENLNGDMDSGFMGIPMEPYGFSNNAKSSFGPPKWSDVKFSIKSPSIAIAVNLE